MPWQSQTLIRGWRMGAVLLLFVLFSGYITVRLFQLQIMQHQQLAGKAEANITSTERVLPNRGLVRDAKGYLLAGDTLAQDLYLDKAHLTDGDIRTLTDLLSPVLEQSPDELYERVRGYTQTTTLLLYRRLDGDAADRVNQLRADRPLMRGNVWLDPQPRRDYPNGPFAAQVLGFADYDNVGRYGVEEYYNDQLAGQEGRITAERDSDGYVLPVGDVRSKPAVDGADLTLTLDSAVQFMVEKELATTIRDTGSKDGLIIVMDPYTGALIAQAAYPSFDPNNYSTATNWGLFKNPVVSNQYEPGSTFKILSYAAAIDGGAVTPDTTFNCTGTIKVYGWDIWNSDKAPHGQESMKQGFARSCNIAMDYAASQLGEKEYFKYLQAFGLGQPTGIDLAGEVPGTLALPGDSNYSPLNLYTNAFGQGVAVTPLQLITGVSAIVNGGNLMRPYMVSSVSRNGKIVQQNAPTVVRRVLKPESAAAVRGMMVYAVGQGLGQMAAIPGYQVGAKTGTAQVPGRGDYSGEGTLASVVGFMPAQDPKFVIYVMLNDPQSSPWGAYTASPAMARLGTQLLQYYKIPPTEPIAPPTATPKP